MPEILRVETLLLVAIFFSFLFINLALTLRIIKAGLEPPKGVLMVYPCLLLDLKYASPSSFQALDDPMLHISLLKLCISSYVGKEFKGLEDPFISPVVANDELLAKLPPVRIITGSEDPMQDDNWRLVAKLRLIFYIKLY